MPDHCRILATLDGRGSGGPLLRVGRELPYLLRSSPTRGGGASILNGSSQERGTPGYGRDLGQVPQPAPRLTHSFIILAFIFYRRTMVGLFVKRSQGYWQNYLPVPGQDLLLSFFSLFQFIL